MRFRDIGLALTIAGSVAVAIGTLSRLDDGPVTRLSSAVFDFYQRAVPRPAGDLPILIVEIDDHSLAELGQWPWPRTRLATLIEQLAAAKPAAIGLDILLAEPDRTSPVQAQGVLEADGAPSEPLAKLLAGLPDHDVRMAQAMAQVPVVVGTALTQDTCAQVPKAKAGFSILGADTLGKAISYAGAITPIATLNDAAAGVGFLNVFPDADGRVRHTAMIARLGDKLYPSFDLELIRVGTGTRSYTLRDGLLRIGNKTTALEPDGAARLYYGGGFKHIAAADVLAGRFEPSAITGKFILVGATASGLPDYWPTPLGRTVAGIDIHAQALADLLGNSWLSRPDWLRGGELIAAVILITSIALVGMFWGLTWSGPFTSLIVVSWFAASWWAFTQDWLLLDPVAGAEMAILTSSGIALLRYLRSEAAQRRLRTAFSRYLAPALVDELAAHPERLRLGGENRIITVMFCDIRGFSALSKNLDPRDVTALLNAFFSPMTDIILAHRGTIDKYIGDCIMAYWNAPIDNPAHALNAVQAAIAMRHALGAVNDELNGSLDLKLSLQMAIGINTGECCIGNMGSHHRFDYSVIGDSVNVAARLVEIAANQGVDLAIGASTAAALPSEDLTPLQSLFATGALSTVTGFTVLPDAEAKLLPAH